MTAAELLRRFRARWSRPRSGIAYWENRVQKFGERAVLNIGHSAAEMDDVTERQWHVLEPLLRSQLRGDERRALDFGCGSGRFSGRIAKASRASVLGVDPIASLVVNATRSGNVSFALTEDELPARNAAFDIVWICLVLGVIVDDDKCRHTASEILRVLKPGGLLFLVENTSEKNSRRHIRFRSAVEYMSMFEPLPLSVIGAYDDLGETISVLAGRSTT